jgi:hypothetical protein
MPDIIFYTTPQGSINIEVFFEDETFWLTQRKMAELFGVEVNTINYHLKEIFQSAELQEEAVVRKIRITAADGKNYLTNHYNLDAIISVGYRVNSQRATQFRVWSNNTLREFIVKGFVLDDERLKQGRRFAWTSFKAMNTPTEWRARFHRNRWVVAWTAFALLFGFMIVEAVLYWQEQWLSNFLSSYGTGLALLLAVLIYAHGQAAQAKTTREYMQHLQQLNQEEIAEMRKLFQQQMDHLSAQTNRQITEYSRETLKVVSKLEENSLLLGEILKRNLEESISDFNSRLAQAQIDLSKVESWQPMRTPEQKAAQVANQYTRITQLQQARDYLLTKYHKLRGMFLHNNHLEP